MSRISEWIYFIASEIDVFIVTIRSLVQAHIPFVGDAFIKQLGVNMQLK
jgi:hypothetical protein